MQGTGVQGTGVQPSSLSLEVTLWRSSAPPKSHGSVRPLPHLQPCHPCSSHPFPTPCPAAPQPFLQQGNSEGHLPHLLLLQCPQLCPRYSLIVEIKS